MSTTLTLSYEKGEALNAVVDYMLLEKSRLVDSLASLELEEGAAALFGSGDNKIVKIKITYENPTEEDLQDIEEIIAIAKNFNGDDGAEKLVITRTSQ